MPYKDPTLRKKKHAEYSRSWYEKNKRLVIERSKQRRRRARAEWDALKKTLACTNCGENHPATLDFHHINQHDPEKKKVFILIRNGQFERAMEEVRTKCVVLCSNCHRKHHHAERKSVKRKAKSKNRCTQ